ncbi:MAG: MerR family transcriptional regulator [Thermoanaerobaculia bacterium]|nr:MerR family transcriptional regulator [Thermoanaerobaculia bacterium]
MSKKLFYRIGEACKKLDIQPYVLRYWETEFSVLSPKKSRSGQRVYSEEELALIRRIKELLYEEGYTIAGAKKKLESELDGNDQLLPSAGEGTAEVVPVVDTRASKRIETLEHGLREAAEEARSIAALLG